MINQPEEEELVDERFGKIAKILWIHRVASVHIGGEGIVVVLENNQKLFFTSDKDKPVNPGN